MGNIVEYIIATVITTGSILAFCYFVFKESVKAFVTHSIKLQYDKLLEDYKLSLIQKQKAVLIGELLAEWMSYPEDRKKLNQLTFEAFMWLPKETAIKLSSLLSLSQDAPEVRTIIGEVRAIILGENEKIDSNVIIIFPPKEKVEPTKNR